MKKIHPFPPIYNDKTEILILGSFPSVKSRQLGFYYMHPTNRFWKVLSILYNDDFVHCSINEKTNKLHKYHLGLFDVIARCKIVNSADQSIKEAVINQIDTIIVSSSIKKIYLNGQKAYSLFMNNFPELAPMTFLLPSTSSANASYHLADLINKWKVLKE